MACEPQPVWNAFHEACDLAHTSVTNRLFIRGVRCGYHSHNRLALFQPAEPGEHRQRWLLHNADTRHCGAFIRGPGSFGLDFIVLGRHRMSRMRTGRQLLAVAVDLILDFHRQCQDHGDAVEHHEEQLQGVEGGRLDLYTPRPDVAAVYAHRRHGTEWECRAVPLGASDKEHLEVFTSNPAANQLLYKVADTIDRYTHGL